MTMGLKGSRKVIETLEREAAAMRRSSGQAQPAAQPVSPAPAPASSSEVAEPTYTGGTSYYREDTSDGDLFCNAQEAADFGTGFYAELPELQQRGWSEDPTGLVKPADLDYLNTATTLWDSGLLSSSDGNLVFYKNGAVKELQHTARDGVFDIYEIMSGSWQRTDGRGVVMRLKSKWKYWDAGYYHIECSGGSLALNTSFGWRDGVNSSWQTCGLQFVCERWSDEFPEKKQFGYYGSLLEWAEGDVAPKELKWSQLELKGRN